jgi:queuosine precursor transporter
VDRKQVLYLWLGGLFVTALVVADLIGGRFFRVGSIDLSSGMLLFPLTFVLTDVINEFYGAKGARRITFLGLGTATFTFLVVSLVMALPPSKVGTDPTTVAKVLGTSQRLFIASLSAYFLGQLSDIAIFGVLRRVTGHRMIWLRATGSTLVSQALDTMVVTFGLLVGTQPIEAIFRIVLNQYLLKVVIAVGLTPIIYAAHALIIRGLKVNESPQTS